MNRNIKLFELKNEYLEVTLSNLGASIFSIIFDNALMTMTPKNIEDFAKENIYYGKSVGPIANRVKDGLVDIAGKKYQLDKNEGNNSLHSGHEGISNQIFDVSEKENKIIFTLKNRSNLPGTINYEIIYELDKNTLLVTFNVTSDEDTIIALTNHSYFSLGDKDISSLSLRMKSNEFIEVDKGSLIPLRKRKILDCLDFNNLKLISKDINDNYLVNSKTNGYDHFFFVDDSKISLSSDRYRLEISSNFEGAQIYSDNYPDDVDALNSENKVHRSIAIEPADSYLDREVLKKNKLYHRYIKYKFTKI